ncbi:MAG: hypothetical protein IJQ81_18055 [Oscillibacter sp.]|nr:hypothetical protein [Oscillibacter sp.]
MRHYFSALFASGVYRRTGVTEPDENGGRSPLLTHALTGKEYFLRRVSLPPAETLRTYESRVLHPPRNGLVLWPADLIPLSSEDKKECTLFAENRYGVPGARKSPPDGAYAAAFPSEFLSMRDSGRVRRILRQNWRSEEVRRFAVQLVRLLDQLNQDGYFYADFHVSRFLFRKDGRLILDYSPFVCSGKELRREDGLRLPRASNCSYPVEFADPSVIRGITPNIDFESQNYQLSAFLFFLLFGRLAYDGRLLSGRADDDGWSHELKFRDYHRNPIFIFDPEDRENSPGYFAEDSHLETLWEELPPPMRELFIRSLRKENAERSIPADNPGAGEWLEIMERLGWA